MSEKNEIGLPENAARELKPGEKYEPILPSNQVVPEVSAYSVSLGLVMAILFSAAAAYLGLKVGQVFEAAIPIAIIAVGLSNATKRKNALGENVIKFTAEGLAVTAADVMMYYDVKVGAV